MIFPKVCINFSPVLCGWEEGRGGAGGVGCGGGKGGGKTCPGEDTR